MKKLPIGIQTFSEIITHDYIYVDKTQYIHSLINNKICFLSRPRRFGKSLLVSTLQALFEGKKVLFKNLWIENHWDFSLTYPVIQFALSSVDTSNPKSIRESLISLLNKNYERHGLTLETSEIKIAFDLLIEGIVKKTGKQVVILIDEYDKPILDYMYRPKELAIVRDILRQFYGILKDQEKNTRFLLLTGVSKFSKLSVFSELNNLQDISQNEKYSQMLGLTQQEIKHSFKEYIPKVAARLKLSEDQLLDKIKFWYNGFSFDGISRVYNPFSLLNFFETSKFRNYWMQSGSSSFLIQYIKKHNISCIEFEGMAVSDDFADKQEIEIARPESFLFQTGYLTLKSESMIGYYLCFPNMEVRKSFSDLVLISKYHTEKDVATISNEILLGFEANDFQRIFNAIQVLFATIPSKLFEKSEKYYHSLLLTLFWATGIEVIAEDYSNIGNSDLILFYKDDVYVIEVKLDKPAASALQQIKDKKYYEKYLLEVGFHLNTEKSIYLLGISANSADRNLKEFIIEQLP